MAQRLNGPAEKLGKGRGAKPLPADPAEAVAPANHNGGPGEEVLFLSHLARLRAKAAKVEAKKAEYDAVKSELTDAFRLAKADGFTRKELQVILDDGKSSRRDLEAEEERRLRLRAWAGLPTGTQSDLFASGPETPEAAKDELAWEGDGYLVGMRAGERKAPDLCPPGPCTQAFLKGYDAGQERNAWALAEAGVNPERGPNQFDGAEADPDQPPLPDAGEPVPEPADDDMVEFSGASERHEAIAA